MDGGCETAYLDIYFSFHENRVVSSSASHSWPLLSKLFEGGQQHRLSRRGYFFMGPFLLFLLAIMVLFYIFLLSYKVCIFRVLILDPFYLLAPPLGTRLISVREWIHSLGVPLILLWCAFFSCVAIFEVGSFPL